MSNQQKGLAGEMSKDREIEELRKELEEAKKAKEEIKNDDQNSAEANADEPEKVNGTVEDQPKDLPAVTKRSVKEKFRDWKGAHPRASKWIARAGIGVAIAGGWILGSKSQEKKDAKMVQAAIDNGELIRVNQEMLEDAEADNNENYEE